MRVAVDGKPAFTYVGEPLRLPPGIEDVYERGGYIHPVMTPSGRRVTEDYPPNHKHHHGIWAAWTSTRFAGRTPDFWNMGDRKGTVEFERLGARVVGAAHRRLRVAASLHGPARAHADDGPARGLARRCLRAGRRRRGRRTCSISRSRRHSTGTSPLELPTYRYGGVGMRGRHEWDGKDKTFFLTSTGRGRLPGHGTRATWVHMSGDVDGQRAGIAMLSHPDNVRSPQPMRIHPTEPFFNFAPQQAGPFAIRPGEVFRMRYRFVVMDGPPDAALLDAMWQDYALPVRARVE